MIKAQIKTVLLLGLLTVILLLVGQAMAGKIGLIVALAFVMLMNFGTYWFSDKIILAMYKAKEVKDQNSLLYNTVKEVSEDAKMPMPKVYMIPTQTPNAFATGRSPKNAAIACTDGILGLLNKSELKGVIAHEISHIKNRDILIATIAATIAGVISYIAMMARFGAMFGGLGGRDGRGGNMLGLLVLAIITPIIALIIQLAISRSREYLADETGARLIKNPGALADALGRLEHGNKLNPMRLGNPATSSLFIVNPFSAGGIISLLSTHPPLAERIKRLKGMDL